MIDTNRALEPLREAAGALAKLQDYESSAELAAAIQATHAAVQKSLRYLLRADKGAPDDVRLAALSPTEMTADRLIPALRQRDLISLDMAGQLHELEQARQRAEAGNARASDADLALRLVDQLGAEIQNNGERNVRAIAHTTVETGPLDEPHSVPGPAESRRPMRFAVLAVAVIALLLVAWLLTRNSPTEKGIAQFDAKQYTAAEQTLSAVHNKNPGDAQAAYYLAVLYRRSNRLKDAGEVLRRAIEKQPDDVYLREELGNVFMALGRPELAAKQYRVAQEKEPDNTRHWVRLVTALRQAGDPEAEAVLQRAPEEARALLSSPK